MTRVVQALSGQQEIPFDPSPTPTPEAGSTSTGNTFTDLYNFADAVKTFLFELGWTIFFIGIAIVAIMNMTSFSSERRMAAARIALVALFVGLFFILGAQGAANLFQNAFQAGGNT